MLIALGGALIVGVSLGLLGSGGSVLTVPVLHYLLGQPEQEAIGGSLLVVGVIAAAAAVPHAAARQVDWRNVGWFGVPGMAGAWLGASLARHVPGVAQLGGFCVAMFVIGWKMLHARSLPAPGVDGAEHRLAIVAAGLGVGAMSGFVGVGGGFLIVPALVLVARVPLLQAVGTSLAIIALNAFAGFVKYLDVLEARGIELDWPVLGLVAAVGIVGSQLGHRAARRLPQATIRRLFGVVILAVGTAIAIELGGRFV